ncbi:hypothetical protein BFJ68_g17206 [Fusarium oxysporum]|uniref:Uncharacterized protein n=1 Tax=Fusarium oxysporum TaxID=5507 RepID=A0A420N9K0_FUSOX|nr:hypothetical protein BFJ71_g16849 [Fusarium oxysporum]RKK85905.1 hypothetical protein BFJ68_g17206 [Fusarium oxysporum]
MKAMGDQCAYQERPSSSKTLTLSDVNNRLQSLEVKVRGDPHLRRNVGDTPLASGSSTVIPVLMEQSASHQSHDAAEETVYGPSSNISFLQEVIQLQDPEMDTTQSAQSSACPNERTMPDLLGFTEVQSPSLAHDVDLVSLPDLTFGAASTLLAASLCPDLEVNLDFDPAKTSWERALQIFEFHKSHVESAAKGIEALNPDGFIDQFVDSGDGHMADSMPFDGAPAVDESWLTGMADDFNEFFTSDSLEQSWLSSQSIDWAM